MFDSRATKVGRYRLRIVVRGHTLQHIATLRRNESGRLLWWVYPLGCSIPHYLRIVLLACPGLWWRIWRRRRSVLRIVYRTKRPPRLRWQRWQRWQRWLRWSSGCSSEFGVLCTEFVIRYVTPGGVYAMSCPPIVCDPRYRVRNCYIPRVVPYVHPIVTVNRNVIVNVPRHYYVPTTRNVVVDPGCPGCRPY
jgi:hypothetical protein